MRKSVLFATGFFFLSLMSWYFSDFGPAKVPHNRLCTRNQRLGGLDVSHV